MEQKSNRSTHGRLQESKNIVDIHYQQTGEASATNKLGMREMQKFSAMRCKCLIFKENMAEEFLHVAYS